MQQFITMINSFNLNLILDTQIFQVKHLDDRVEEYVTNIIAESLLSNADEEGFGIGWIDEVIDHCRKDSSLSTSEGFVTSGTATKPVITTKGWDIQVRWKDGSTDWMPLSQVKEAIPVELAEYTVAQKINKEPAFNWWVLKILRKRGRIINKIGKRKAQKPRMKFWGGDSPNCQ